MLDTLEMVKKNFLNVNEFQSIQNLHELVVALQVENWKQTKGDKTFNPEWKVGEDVFGFKESAIQLINNTFVSFGEYSNYGMQDGAEDKSVNAHNCRKSSILS